MKQVAVSLFFSAALGLGAFTLCAQQQQAPPPSPKQGAPSQPQGEANRDVGQAEKVTLTGCLLKGGGTGEYAINDTNTHEKVTFPGPAQLDKYVNQSVRLTGSMAVKGNGDKVFQPETVATVATSC